MKTKEMSCFVRVLNILFVSYGFALVIVSILSILLYNLFILNIDQLHAVSRTQQGT